MRESGAANVHKNPARLRKNKCNLRGEGAGTLRTTGATAIRKLKLEIFNITEIKT